MISMQDGSHAIYGVGTLAKLYREFTRETIFNSSRQWCVKPTMGGSYFGDIRREGHLDKKSFRVISSLVCKGDAQIEGHLPLGKLYYFNATNQEYYKNRATRYFNLIKYRLYELNKKNETSDCLWCFFPMYWTDRKHLIVNNLSAYVLWFEIPPRPKAKIMEMELSQ